MFSFSKIVPCLYFLVLISNTQTNETKELRCYVCVDCTEVNESHIQTCIRPSEPTTNYPANNTDESTTPITSVPTDATTINVSTNNPITSSSTDAPTTDVPTDATTINVTTNKPITSVPTDAPTTVVPTDASTINVTTNRPITSVSTDTPTTVVPTDATTINVTTNEPTTSAPTVAPTIFVPTEASTINLTTNKPTTSASTDVPNTTAPTEGPITSVSTDAPTTNGPTGAPTSIAPTDVPSSSMPVDAPPTSSISSLPSSPISSTEALVTNQPDATDLTSFKIVDVTNNPGTGLISRSRRDQLVALRRISDKEGLDARCVVTTIVDNNTTKVVRGCSFGSGTNEDRCRGVIGGSFIAHLKECKVCQGDRCNSSIKRAISFILLLPSLLLTFKY